MTLADIMANKMTPKGVIEGERVQDSSTQEALNLAMIQCTYYTNVTMHYGICEISQLILLVYLC